MSIFRNAIRSRVELRAIDSKIGECRPLFMRWPKNFSTESEQQPSSPSPGEAPLDSFLKTPVTGPVYGKLQVPPSITKHTLKTDIIRVLEGCGLTPDDVKFDYNRAYAPVGMLVQFPSTSAYGNALKNITKKGRFYRLERADRSQWDLLSPFDGRAVLLQGIPRNALQEDIERFLSGCDYDQTSMQIFVKPGIPDPIRMALVRFPSQTEAMNAFIKKNRGFCLNSQITVRVLQ